MGRILKFILAVLFLPVVLSVEVFRSDRGGAKKMFWLFGVWIFVGVFWYRGYTNLAYAVNSALYEAGVIDKTLEVPVKGTSMLPTIKDGENIVLHSPKKYSINRGDIVSFQNLETGPLHYLKRVVGLPDDQLLIKNGDVLINGKTLKEGYVYQDSPTYGNTFLLECEQYTVPPGKFVVMGDNRLASTDSRVVGFVDKRDIDGVINTGVTPEFAPISDQIGQNMTLDVKKFVNKLNAKRGTAGTTPLQLSTKLSGMASKRAASMAKNLKGWKDFQEPLTQVLDQEKYDYLVVQEVNTMGNYSEDQLVDHLLELVPYNYDFLSGKYYELGFGVSVGVTGECRLPVIDIILSWPPKPTNSKEVAQSYQKDTETYSEVVAGLKQLKNVGGINTTETQELIDRFTSLLNKANRLSAIALEDRWLTQSESKQFSDYNDEAKQVQKQLADYVNKYETIISKTAADLTLTNYQWGSPELVKESNQARLLYSQEKYSEVLTSAEKILKLATANKERAVGYYWQGLGYYGAKQFTQARNSMLEAIKNDPDYAAPYSTLAAINFNDQNFTQGLAYAQKCVALDSKYAWCHNNLAIAYYNLGQKTKALEEIQLAVSLAPESVVFNDNLKRMRAGQ